MPNLDSRRMLLLLTLGLALLTSGNARAEEENPTLSSAAGRGGFQLTSPDGDFVIKFRGIIQADSRMFLQEQATAQDTFTLRRVRPIIEGTVYRIFDFRFTPDFGGGTTVLQDGYLDARFHPAFKLRFGKAKSPFGLERLQSASDIVLIERSLATFLVPNRDLGIQAIGDLAGSKVSYALALMNGVVDGGSADADLSGGKDVVGRVFAQPVAGLGVGIAFSAGNEEGTLQTPGLPAYRTSGQQPFFRYRVATTPDAAVLADGTRTRFSPQFYYYRGPAGVLGEFVQTSQEVRRDMVTQTIENKAWNLTATWVLTGEKASYKYVTPTRPFDLDSGGWGAFEIAARYSELDIDDDAFPLFSDPSLFSTRAKEWAIGLNWYLNKNVKFVVNYDQTNFDGGALKTEKLLVSRFQIAF